jgi:peptide/nickel transport system substrate-binding protein
MSVKPFLAALFGLLALLSNPFDTAVAAPRTDLNLGVRLEPPHLDPTAGAAAAIGEIGYANIFEGLTRIDRNGRVQPALAASWEISEDGKVYTFHLRTGVTFHDGAPFSADSVKFSLDRARGETSVNPQKGLFEPIDSIDIVEPATVRMILKRPTGAFLFNLGWPAAVMISSASADMNKTAPVGTGPFKFVGWMKGSSVELARNETYWGKPVKLDKITFKFVSDPTAAYAAMLAQQAADDTRILRELGLLA